MKKGLKLAITGKHQGNCQTCFQTVTGYDAKFGDGFAAFLCNGCMDKQIDHRQDEEEKSTRPLLKEANRADSSGGEQTAPTGPKQNLRSAG